LSGQGLPGLNDGGSTIRGGGTVRQLPSRVYWVRRGVVVGIPLLLVLVVVVAVRGAGNDGGAAAATPSPTSTATSSLPGGIGTCDPGALSLGIAATAQSYSPGVSPGFSVTITNTGTEPCLVDAGDTHREIVVTSGSDRIWSTKDCAPQDADDRTLLLTPGSSDTQQVAWNLVRSVPGCSGGLPDPAAGTYAAAFSVGGAGPVEVSFVLKSSADADQG
jgi:hypothetical protein